MKVLITRPREDADRTAAALIARGHEPLIAPLLEIRFREGPEIALDDVQAIVVTSANGIRALARRTARRDLPVFTVGPQSAEAARAEGFADVKSADGDAAALAAAVTGWARPEGGALFHPAGAQTRGGLAEALTATGFTVRGEILYEAVPVRGLPPEAVAAIGAGGLGAVLLYSPRSARLLAEALARAGLSCGGIEALCISDAAARAVENAGFKAVRTAARPDEAGMLALIE